MQQMDDAAEPDAAEPVTQVAVKIITHLQPVGFEVLEEKKYRPIQDGSFWGIRWKGGRKMALAVVPQEIQQLPIHKHQKSSYVLY